jgi:hypothetical protein
MLHVKKKISEKESVAIPEKRKKLPACGLVCQGDHGCSTGAAEVPEQRNHADVADNLVLFKFDASLANRGDKLPSLRCAARNDASGDGMVEQRQKRARVHDKRRWQVRSKIMSFQLSGRTRS